MILRPPGFLATICSMVTGVEAACDFGELESKELILQIMEGCRAEVKLRCRASGAARSVGDSPLRK